MYSEALRIMDRNTIGYMIEQQQKEIEEQKKELRKKDAALEEQKQELQEKDAVLKEQFRELAKLRQELELLKRNQ